MRGFKAAFCAGISESRMLTLSRFLLFAALLFSTLILLTSGCVHKQPGQITESRIVSYSAFFRCNISYKNRETAFWGGCAIDPERGGRIEFRDLMGGTVVMVLLDRRRATAVSPSRELKCTWTGSGSSFPWSPADLWSVFSGRYPTSRLRSKGLTTSAKWRSGSRRIRAELTCSEAGLPVKAILKGPGDLRLTIRFSNARPSSFKEDTFRLPKELSYPEADPTDVFSGVLP